MGYSSGDVMQLMQYITENIIGIGLERTSGAVTIIRIDVESEKLLKETLGVMERLMRGERILNYKHKAWGGTITKEGELEIMDLVGVTNIEAEPTFQTANSEHQIDIALIRGTEISEWMMTNA